MIQCLRNLKSETGLTHLAQCDRYSIVDKYYSTQFPKALYAYQSGQTIYQIKYRL